MFHSCVDVITYILTGISDIYSKDAKIGTDSIKYVQRQQKIVTNMFYVVIIVADRTSPPLFF